MTRMLAVPVLALIALPLAAADAGSPQAFELRLLTKMPHHHQGGAEMADLCTQRGAKPELKNFCANLGKMQREEKQQMDSWRQNWYAGKTAPQDKEMQRMMAKHKKDMAKLEATRGAEFDRAFLNAMIEHHRDGMPDMKACQARATHNELKQLCGKMEAEQNEEVKKMQGWLETGGAKKHP